MNADAAGTAKPTSTGDEARVGGFLRTLRQRVGSNAGRTALPQIEQAVRQVQALDDLATRFVSAATAAGLRVHRASKTDWAASVREVLRSCGAKTAFIAAQAGSALTEEGARQLADALLADGLTTTSAVDDETLFSVDVAVTGVTMAVAETGTIVCQSGPKLARGASLIPPLHVAVVTTSQLVPDLYDGFARLAASEELPANVNLITGPSKTADIEGILITGVHGPREVHIILVAD